MTDAANITAIEILRLISPIWAAICLVSWMFEKIQAMVTALKKSYEGNPVVETGLYT
jgi:hypothetical protein